MNQNPPVFLPGVPADLVVAAISRAGGNELESGKLLSPESSAALAVNTFGWFIERPDQLPLLPNLGVSDWPPVRVDVERQMRFPWQGGMHPWLDAAVETETALIGIESKRYEPFRDKKVVSLSAAYDRDVWGDQMQPYTALRDSLRSGKCTFSYLDATQLIKHAFGLVTQANTAGKAAHLLYLFAEPKTRADKLISTEQHVSHRQEIAVFADLVSGAAVQFAACSYREWLATWPTTLQPHSAEIVSHFDP
jgi:hypothetical protein